VTQGLSLPQAKTILHDHPEEHIRSKISQLEFLKKHCPDKIKGSGIYLYNAIRHHWQSDEYERFLAKEREKSANSVRLESVSHRKNLESEYQNYLDDTYHHAIKTLKPEILSEIEITLETLLDKPIYRVSSEFYQAARELKRRLLVLEKVPVMSLEEFSKQSELSSEIREA
jgi:hypothetical protein